MSDIGDEEDVVRPEARKPRKKPVRRVRVIELIDEDDDELDVDQAIAELDLDALDAAAEAAEAPAAPVKKAKRAPAADAEADAATAEAADEAPAEAADAGEKKAEPAGSAPKVGLGALRGYPLLVTVLAILVVAFAALSSVSLAKWHSYSAKQADRKAAGKVAKDFAAALFTYDASDIQSQLDHTAALMTGDIKTRFVGREASIKSDFTTNPTLKLVGKSTKAVIGDASGKFIDVVVTVKVTMSSGASSVPSTAPFTVTLAKVKGHWLASGIASTDPDSGSDQSLPGVAGSASPSASAGK